MFIDRMVWDRRDIKNHLVPEGTPSSRPARAGPSTASLGSLFPITLTVKDFFFFFFNVYSSALKLFCCSQPACFYGILKMKFFIIVLLMQLEEGCGKRPCCIWWVHLFFSGSNLFYTNAWLFSKDTLKMKQTKTPQSTLWTSWFTWVICWGLLLHRYWGVTSELDWWCLQLSHPSWC